MKAKKFISAVSALVMTASAMATCVSVSAAGEDVILSGDQIECKAGAKFSLSVNLAELNGEAGQGFSGCEFAIEYDPSMITIDDVNYLIESADHIIKNGVHYVKLGLGKFG